MSVPVFCCFLFQKRCSENILGIGRNKSQSPYFLTRTRSPEERRRGAVGRPHHMVARPHLLPRRHVVRGPRASTDVAPSPIYSSRHENPKTPSHISKKHPLPPPSTLTRGVQKFSSGTLPERGIITGVLYIAMPASGVMCE